MREPDAKRQSSADGRLHGEGLAGQHHRVARVGGHHCRAQFDIRHLATDHGQQGQCVVPEDLRGPGRIEADVMEALHLGDHIVDRLVHIEHHTDFHDSLPGPSTRRDRS